MPLNEAKAYGVISVDAEGQVVKFSEKPEQPDPIPGQSELALASMGIYVFNTAFLYEQLIKDADDNYSTHDFGNDIIPRLIEKYRIMSYPFRDTHDTQTAYWRDVGTIDAFWKANLELIGVLPELNLYDETWPIWTYQEQLPPAKFIFDDEERRGMALDSMVSGGCVISGAIVRHSLLFSNVRVNSYTELQDVVALPDVSFGRDCRITKAIIDKGCELPEGTVIGEDAEEDAKQFYVSPNGVVLVTPEMLGQEIHHVR